MSFIGNILWLIFGGLLAGLGYIIGGLVLCLTIVGIPFGLQSIKLGVSTFAPFGRDVIELNNANSVLRVVFNVLWILLFGDRSPGARRFSSDHDHRHSFRLSARQAGAAVALSFRPRSAARRVVGGRVPAGLGQYPPRSWGPRSWGPRSWRQLALGWWLRTRRDSLTLSALSGSHWIS